MCTFAWLGGEKGKSAGDECDASIRWMRGMVWLVRWSVCLATRVAKINLSFLIDKGGKSWRGWWEEGPPQLWNAIKCLETSSNVEVDFGRCTYGVAETTNQSQGLTKRAHVTWYFSRDYTNLFWECQFFWSCWVYYTIWYKELFNGSLIIGYTMQ